MAASILDYYDLKINFNEGVIPSDILILAIIEKYNIEEALIGLLNTYSFFQKNKEASYEEKYDFFYKLITKVNSLLDNYYSEDDIKLYISYIMPLTVEDFKNEQIIKDFEQCLKLNPSGENEKFCKEKIKYKLLQLYSENSANNDKYYEKMKILLAQLKTTRNSYLEKQKEIEGIALWKE